MMALLIPLAGALYLLISGMAAAGPDVEFSWWHPAVAAFLACCVLAARGAAVMADTDFDGVFKERDLLRERNDELHREVESLKAALRETKS